MPVTVATPLVFDKTGGRRDWTWLQEKYGHVEHKPDLDHPTRFILTSVYETCGQATIVVRSFHEDGSPRHGDNIGLYWPGPEKPVSTEHAIARWQPYVGAWQPTDPNGHTGFGFGGGSVIKDGYGPHWCWVLSPTVGSDALAHFGWDGGTNHCGPLSFDFRLMVQDEPPGPDPEPPEPGTCPCFDGWQEAESRFGDITIRHKFRLLRPPDGD